MTDIDFAYNVHSFGLQIEDGDIFIPEQIGNYGMFAGMTEVTKPEDNIKNYKLTSRVWRVSYIKDGLQYDNYYANGKYSKNENDMPILRCWGLLNG